MVKIWSEDGQNMLKICSKDGQNMVRDTIILVGLTTVVMIIFPAMAMMFVTKKGSQQIMNTPITVPKVFAAFVSFEILVMKKYYRSQSRPVLSA